VSKLAVKPDKSFRLEPSHYDIMRRPEPCAELRYIRSMRRPDPYVGTRYHPVAFAKDALITLLSGGLLPAAEFEYMLSSKDALTAKEDRGGDTMLKEPYLRPEVRSEILEPGALCCAGSAPTPPPPTVPCCPHCFHLWHPFKRCFCGCNHWY
jgi:hypothetical protein